MGIIKMPRGRGKGGNKRKRGKNMNFDKRELVYKEEDQDYGQVMRLLGGGRVEVNCLDGNVKRLCTIRGKMKNRVWINGGDIVLVSLREFGDDKADIIHKYYAEEAFELQDLGELPENLAVNEGAPDDDEEAAVDSEEEKVDEDGVV